VDDFTNYVLSFVLAIGVWGVGALHIRRNSNDSLSYVRWLKIWAVTAIFQTVVFSVILGVLFPSPELAAVEDTVTSSLTDPENAGLSPEVVKELEEASK